MNSKRWTSNRCLHVSNSNKYYFSPKHIAPRSTVCMLILYLWFYLIHTNFDQTHNHKQKPLMWPSTIIETNVFFFFKYANLPKYFYFCPCILYDNPKCQCKRIIFKYLLQYFIPNTMLYTRYYETIYSENTRWWPCLVLALCASDFCVL